MLESIGGVEKTYINDQETVVDMDIDNSDSLSAYKLWLFDRLPMTYFEKIKKLGDCSRNNTEDLLLS